MTNKSTDKSNTEVAAQDFAEQLGERFRHYLDLEKINRAIHPTCGICKSLKGSDGHIMLAQEFIGNLVRPIITTAQSHLANAVLAELEQWCHAPAASNISNRLRDLFTRLGIEIES